MDTRRRLIVGVLAATASAGALLAVPAAAQADQHGTNYCVKGVFAVHQSADGNSSTVGNISSTEVWHHYKGVGNWSLGYVRGDAEVRRGYIPRGALTRDLGNGSSATVCPT